MTKTMKNKGGRPAVVLTNEQIVQVEDLSTYLTCEQIGDYLGISHDTFTRIKQRDDLVLRAYKKGKAKKILRYSQKLEAKAMGGDESGDTTAIIFFLKTQAGWSTEPKKEEKPNLDFLKDKEPLEIIESTLVALEKGEITIQQAQQISNLAMTKLNMKNNLSGMDIIDQEQRTEEEIMAKVCAIAKAIDYQEKLNSKK